MHPDVSLIAINDGNNPQSWGTGAYHGGALVSNMETFSIPQQEQGSQKEDYEHILSVSLPVTTEGPSFSSSSQYVYASLLVKAVETIL